MKTRLIQFLILVVVASIVYSFGIFTNNQAYYRKYLDSDLPFVYKVHWSTSNERIGAVQAGSQTWNDVAGAYFEFSYGGTTFSNSVTQDGTNLVYFDSTWQNFTPGTSTIAFSSTFTSGSGSNYHATESDLIWNAGDFPPATDGTPSQQDLQSVITHEFGHHLGLGHQGPVGGPPGVGEEIQAATMYGTIGNGDTTKRSLHIHDIMGVVSIYPRWTISGQIKDQAGNAVPNAFYYLGGMESALVLPPLLVGNRWQAPGYVITDTVFVDDPAGNYKIIPRFNNPHLTVNAYGFLPVDTLFNFSPTDVANSMALDIVLQPAPLRTVTIEVMDSLTSQPLTSHVRYFAQSDLSGNPTILDTSNASGVVSTQAASDIFTIEVKPELPYAYKVLGNVAISNDTTIQVKVNVAEILLVDDDYNPAMSAKDDRQNVYFNLLNTLGRYGKYAYREAHSDLLADAATLGQIPTIMWFTGSNPQSALGNFKTEVETYINAGHNFYLGGNYVFSAVNDSAFMNDYLHGRLAGNSTTQLMRGTSGDPIGNNEFLSIDYPDAELIETDGMPETKKVFTFLGKQTSGMIRSGYGAKVILSTFDISNIFAGTNFLTMETVFSRVLDWLENGVTAVEPVETDILPASMRLEQNYPNPFNPVTTIRFDVNKRQEITLTVFNALGQKVVELLNGVQEAGAFEVQWNGRNQFGQAVSSGVYYYRLKAENFNSVRKMLFIK